MSTFPMLPVKKCNFVLNIKTWYFKNINQCFFLQNFLQVCIYMAMVKIPMYVCQSTTQINVCAKRVYVYMSINYF